KESPAGPPEAARRLPHRIAGFPERILSWVVPWVLLGVPPRAISGINPLRDNQPPGSHSGNAMTAEHKPDRSAGFVPLSTPHARPRFDSERIWVLKRGDRPGVDEFAHSVCILPSID